MVWKPLLFVLPYIDVQGAVGGGQPMWIIIKSYNIIIKSANVYTNTQMHIYKNTEIHK